MQQKEDNSHPEQLNPGQIDQFGNEAVIKKNEGIGEQGNEWAYPQYQHFLLGTSRPFLLTADPGFR